ncbi:hypothetical protein [Azospirillum rugosum]|uniref:Uncharacterized protein n=1 Tax=Azospirillum rugosum TaxID=416170 RepID=A0ABS4SJP9_9PROT|nr:hypothetical protein [Azospirillum rugosum]MBP2292784.1 hypothetical protein [Azospirillum rugosum]MDQ0527043.1 hypothetical protein [Azospirillum rugosum]
MSSSTYRWIKIDGVWEPAREQADGSFMPIGDIVPLAARDVKIGPVIEPPPRNADRGAKGSGAVPSAPAGPDEGPASPDAPLNPA